jgi:hypothetical protein
MKILQFERYGQRLAARSFKISYISLNIFVLYFSETLVYATESILSITETLMISRTMVNL